MPAFEDLLYPISEHTWASYFPIFVDKYKPHDKFSFNDVGECTHVTTYFETDSDTPVWVRIAPQPDSDSYAIKAMSGGYRNNKVVRHFYGASCNLDAIGEEAQYIKEALESLYKKKKNVDRVSVHVKNKNKIKNVAVSLTYEVPEVE